MISSPNKTLVEYSSYKQSTSKTVLFLPSIYSILLQISLAHAALFNSSLTPLLAKDRPNTARAYLHSAQATICPFSRNIFSFSACILDKERPKSCSWRSVSFIARCVTALPSSWWNCRPSREIALGEDPSFVECLHHIHHFWVPPSVFSFLWAQVALVYLR